MVQCHQLPLIIEDRRSRRARLGVGFVMDEVGQDRRHRVVAERQFLGTSRRVLDDIHLLRLQDRVIPRVGWVEAKLGD